MAFPSTPILDNFNRTAEGPPPSANWTSGFFTFGNNMQVQSSAAKITVGGAVSSDCYWNPGTFQAASEAYLERLPNGSCSSYLGVRIATPGVGTTDGYRAFMDDVSFLLRLQRMDDGVATQLGASYDYNALVPMASPGIGLRAKGSELTFWLRVDAVWDTVPRLNSLDSTYPSGGYIGFGQIAANTGNMDDFGGGNIPGNVGSFPTHLGGRGAGW